MPLVATYTFNSYCLTYRYRVRATERTTAWVGLTAKVRDATVELEQGATASRKDNVGFVPFLHLAGEASGAPRRAGASRSTPTRSPEAPAAPSTRR